MFTRFLCFLQKEKHRFLYILKSAVFEKQTHFLSILLHVFFGQDLFNIFCGCAINPKYLDNRLILKQHVPHFYSRKSLIMRKLHLTLPSTNEFVIIKILRVITELIRWLFFHQVIEFIYSNRYFASFQRYPSAKIGHNLFKRPFLSCLRIRILATFQIHFLQILDMCCFKVTSATKLAVK